MPVSTVKLNGAVLMTVNDTTAAAGDVAGKYFYAADGTKTLGALSAPAAYTALESAGVFTRLVWYDCDAHQTLAEDPSSSALANRMGVDRDHMRTVLNQSNPSSNIIRVKISGDIARAASTSAATAWTEGILLEGGHTYRATMTLVSGTVTPPDGTNPPYITLYEAGTTTHLGTLDRVGDTISMRTYTVPAGGAEANLVIYVPASIVLANAAYIATFEDITQ